MQLVRENLDPELLHEEAHDLFESWWASTHSLSYDTFGCSGSMELNPGLSEVVFGLRAEVEALKTRLNKIERGQEVAVSAAYWQAVERERDSSEKKKRHLL